MSESAREFWAEVLALYDQGVTPRGGAFNPFPSAAGTWEFAPRDLTTAHLTVFPLVEDDQ